MPFLLWFFLSKHISVLKWDIFILRVWNLRSTRVIKILILGFRVLVIRQVRNWAQRLKWIVRDKEPKSVGGAPRFYLMTDPVSETSSYVLVFVQHKISGYQKVVRGQPPSGQEGSVRLFLSACCKYEGKNAVLHRLLDLRILRKKHRL